MRVKISYSVDLDDVPKECARMLEKSLQEKTGLTAKIHHKKNSRGTLSFEYNNNDQLDRLVMVIKANY